MNLAKKIAALHLHANSFARVLYSSKPITSFRNIKQDKVKSEYQKPRGLWYECDKGWKEFVQREYRSVIGDYKYKYALEVNLNRMCVIRNEKDFLEFHAKYGFRVRASDRKPGAIDWVEVAKDYDGIEICPYLYTFRMSHSWYYGWDVASGCIWGSGAFKKVLELENDIEDDEFKGYDW